MLIIVATLAFEGLIFGEDLAERSFPTLLEPETANGDCEGFFDGFVCAVDNLVTTIINFFLIIYGGLAFFLNLITFNVPGAPWYVRLVAGAGFGGTILWSILTLIRGN